MQVQAGVMMLTLPNPHVTGRLVRLLKQTIPCQHFPESHPVPSLCNPL